MAHECEYCEQYCFCDMDDCCGLEQPGDCEHLLRPERHCIESQPRCDDEEISFANHCFRREADGLCGAPKEAHKTGDRYYSHEFVPTPSSRTVSQTPTHGGTDAPVPTHEDA